MTIERRIGIIPMEEKLKIIIKCVFSTKQDKFGRLTKKDNIRKKLYSEFQSHHDINTNLFELIDISSKVVDRANYDCKDSPLKLDNIEYLEIEIIDKLNGIRTSMLNVLVERSNVVFYAQ